jgi:hypothetical protein
MIDTRESLNALLPAYVRQRDLASGGAFKELLAIIGDQVVLLERDFARMYDNWFIETCEGWVVPYIGDLLGYSAPGSAMASGNDSGSGASTPRREVANLLAYRRRKGTAALVDVLARNATAWPAVAVELFRQIAVAQHLDHLHAHRLGTADLHDARALTAIDLPFDHTSHLGDVRRTSNCASPGLYDASGLALFVFRTQAFTVTSTSAYCREDIGAHCYTFSILGNDAPLYRHTVPATDACGRTKAPELPLPLERLETELDPTPDAASAAIDPAFYGSGRSIGLYVTDWPKKAADGAAEQPALVPAKMVIPADLADWAYKVPKDHVAVDPMLGRIMFPATQPPRKGIQVDYAYGFAMNLGGGEYGRPLPPMPAYVSRRRVRALDGAPPVEGEFASISDAVADWSKQRAAARGGQPNPERASPLQALVVELADSGIYRGTLDVSLGRGESLWIVAAPLTRPVLWLTDENAGAADALSVRGAAGSRFVLDGILVAGRGIDISPASPDGGEEPEAIPAAAEQSEAEDLCEILIRHCTLVPGWGLSHDCEPRRPSEPSIVLDGSRACLRVDHSIVGAIRANLDDTNGPPARVLIEDSIVDATSETRTAIGAAGDGVAFVRLGVARSTIVGTIVAHELEGADDSLFVGEVTVARRQTGCVRYSYVPQGSRTPRRYRCQPDGVVASLPELDPPDPAERERLVADATLRTAPRFLATRYGSPLYLRLTQCTSTAIARGASDGSEMGVYHDLFEPQRRDRLSASLVDYAPADVDASILIAS